MTIDFGGAAGLIYAGTGSDGPTLRGLTLTNASTALDVDGPFEDGPAIAADVIDCRFRANVRAIDFQWVIARVENTRFFGNTDRGINAFAASLSVNGGFFRQNGLGLGVAGYGGAPWDSVSITGVDIVDNDAGVELVPVIHDAALSFCRVDSNTTYGLSAISGSLKRVALIGCDVKDNGTGIRVEDLVLLEVDQCDVADNAQNGIHLDTQSSDLYVTGSQIRGNTGWGVDGTEQIAPRGGQRRSGVVIEIVDSVVRENAAGGLSLESDVVRIESCLVVDNGGRGAEIFRPQLGAAQFEVVDALTSTIANNLGDAIWTDHDSVVVERVQLTGNVGAAYATTSGVAPALTCSNVFGNGTNYAGLLAGLDGQFGNVAVDPLYCDAAAGDYELVSVSPCLSPASSCGTIGARGLGCVAEPVFRELVDVPDDQGGLLRLTWDASHYDALGSPTPVTGYGIYRKQAEAGGGQGARLLGWDYLTTVPARGDSAYQYVAPTLCDSTIIDGECWTTFFVSAETTQPVVFYDSVVDSGYSLDNLAPPAPAEFNVDYSSNSNQLVWSPSIAPDFVTYLIFRRTDSQDVPSSTDTPDTTTALSAFLDMEFDGAAAWDFTYWVAAMDLSGNRSDVVWPLTATDAPGAARVTEVELGPPVPNPFNPATEIEFAIAGEGPVELRVFDLRGRIVRTLIDEVRASGRYRVRWDGRDTSGQAVASGTYFARLRADGVERTRPMVLLK